MSFPTIPDISPEIDIDFGDAVNLLLTSIAMEEMSLSRLMDAEKDKLLYALDHCKFRGAALRDVLEVNKSVDATLKTMIKLQMLLQFKLENVRELITTSTTTTSTTTTTSSSFTCSTTTNNCCGGCIIVSGAGSVQNTCDALDGQPLRVHAFVPCGDPGKASVEYAAGENGQRINMYAKGNGLQTDCPCCCQQNFAVYGTTQINKGQPCSPDITGQAEFKLTVRRSANGINEFRMEIMPTQEPRICHDSGFVRLTGSNPIRSC